MTEVTEEHRLFTPPKQLSPPGRDFARELPVEHVGKALDLLVSTLELVLQALDPVSELLNQLVPSIGRGDLGALDSC
ncbi:MAG: hypothetical protein ACE5JP_07110 [Candidatus Bipolaricaulia bacterium]